MLRLQQITKQFGDLQVLKGIDLHIEAGQAISIVGTSGAGKTTLLEIMGTLSAPTSGQLYIAGTQADTLNARQIAQLRNTQIGFVFQFHHLLPEFSALENVCIPAWIGKKNKSQTEKYAKELMDYFNLSNRLHHKPMEMSGGEQQRVAIARALINRPSVLLADEPSGNLDSQHKQELHEFLFKLQKDMHQTMVIVTHDQNLAQLCDRQLVMSDGRIAENAASPLLATIDVKKYFANEDER
ncbi:lipoprotein-releasing system ATP-binding protein LolD [Bacteroidia bacterium]|nr:lipoprotein-releasing system ATP-binding protein LolD [Bacteroidia bacterium]